MADCVVEYFDNFKDKLKLQNSLKQEMLRKYGVDEMGKYKFRIQTLDNCVIAIHPSERLDKIYN